MFKEGDKVFAGDSIGTVPEGPFTHKILVPFGFLGTYTIKKIAKAGEYKIHDTIATLADEKGKLVNISMSFKHMSFRNFISYATLTYVLSKIFS